jgi:hypothetical protein
MFFISILAETNRPPFDLPEAESELVAGFMTEHSASVFVFFFLGEYSSLILMSAFMSIFFLGGYHCPDIHKFLLDPIYSNYNYYFISSLSNINNNIEYIDIINKDNIESINEYYYYNNYSNISFNNNIFEFNYLNSIDNTNITRFSIKDTI